MIARVTDPTRLKFTQAPPIVPSGEPFDPETDVVMANTFFAHFVYRALCHAGRFDLVLAHMRERYGRMLGRGATTLWESFDPTASLCHGFSATPVYQLSTEVLGVYPLTPGFERVRIHPRLADLAFARGVFPSVRGDVAVAWKREPGRVLLDIDVPSGTTGYARAPVGYRFAASEIELGSGRHHLEATGSEHGV